MGLFTFFQKSKYGGLAVEPPKNPQDKLGDPITNLKPETVDRDYRSRINRGELAIPSWALHEAMRLTPLLGNYQRLWLSCIGSMDWTVKIVPDPNKVPGDKTLTEHEKRAKKQASTLKKKYEGINVSQAVKHLALANIYGYSILCKKPLKLEPLNWWNFARVGLYGAWFWNPNLRVQDGRNLPKENAIDPANFIIREVEDGCLLEFLRIFLRVNEVEGWWDDNLEKESKRQVALVLSGSLTPEEATQFKDVATSMSKGASGVVFGGTGKENAPQVIFPPESRGLNHYESRIKLLDEWACKALFGAPLVANTAPDSGTLAGNAHMETFKERIFGAARDISSVFQQQYDIGILTEAGLLAACEAPLAYFELIGRKTIDPQKEIEWTAQLKAGGFDREVSELSERTGMTLTKSPAQLPEAPSSFDDSLFNRAGDELGVPAKWLMPIRTMLVDIIAKAEDGKLSDAELTTYLETAAQKIPELFEKMDIDVFAKFLESATSGAALDGVKDALKH